MSNRELSRRSFARLSVAAGLVLASGGLFAGNMGCGKAGEGAGAQGSPAAEFDGKVLVAYFSGTGHTRAVAQTVADELGADLFEVVPEQPYTSDDLNYSDTGSRVSREHDDEAQQDIPLAQTTPDGFADYDAVLLGYPIWWGGAAWPVRRFVSGNDFAGKHVVTFCTSASSGMGDSSQYLAGLAQAADWQDGQRFAGNAAEDEVRAWARSVRDALEAENAAADDVTPGSETYRGFVLDNVLHSAQEGDVHFNLYVPESYTPDKPASLFVTLPGYQGLYFQGVGVNLQTEDFGFEAQSYDEGMIVAAPQLSDWDETSARQTIALVRWLLGAYAIDPGRVFLEGYSGGGETLSLVMGMEPELFCAALFCASRWDGDLEAIAAAHVPVYMVVGESDEYYGSGPAERAASELEGLYREQGLSDEEVAGLVVLDVKPASYFEAGGVTNQHGQGGALFCRDGQIMSWLFER